MNNYLAFILIILIIILLNTKINKKKLYIILGINFLLLCLKKKNKKTYFINLKTRKKITKDIGETIDYVLKNRNWIKLSSSEAKNIDKIDFIFTNINGKNNNKNKNKSQISLRVSTEQENLFSNKKKLKDHFKHTEYFSDYFILNKLNIIKDINILYSFVKHNLSIKKIKKNSYLILKDPYGSLGKQILTFDHNNNSIIYKNEVKEYLKTFKSTYIILEEFLESITFKVPELKFNNKQINYETNFGRRSLIRFFIVILVRNNTTEIYKINNLFIYLAVLPSSNSIKKDILKPGSHITNFYLGSKFINNEKNNLTNKELYNIKLYRDLLYNNKYQKQLFTQLFCVSNNEFKRQYPEKLEIVNTKINNFIIEFSKVYHNEFICKNNKNLNKESNCCFNIYAVDSILTKTNDFKILEINSNPGNITIHLQNIVKDVYNTENIFNDIFDLIENEDIKTKNLTLISKKKSSVI